MSLDADLVVRGIGSLVTPEGPAPLLGPRLGALRVVRDAVVAVRAGEIIHAGPAAGADVRLLPGGRELDAAGAAVVPGFVDAHTHLPYAGDRMADLERRLAGATYKEILEAGGGIHTTVAATRAASRDELAELCIRRLDRMLLHGTTTVECKSGYGMDLETELRQLEAVREAGRRHPATLHATYMGAHVMPREHRDDREGYIRRMCDEVMPAVAAAGLASAVDVFCEEGVYTVPESRRILRRAKELGFQLRIHAEELVTTGGAELAAELGAASADHLVKVSDEGIARLAEAGVCAVLLPATTFYLRHREYAPARAMIARGVPVAVASDLNPGSSNTLSMGLVTAVACFGLGLSIDEALAAATLQGAFALGVHENRGSLERGKRADLLVLDVPDHRALVAEWGVNHVRCVVKDGRVVVEDGRLVGAGAGA